MTPVLSSPPPAPWNGEGRSTSAEGIERHFFFSLSFERNDSFPSLFSFFPRGVSYCLLEVSWASSPSKTSPFSYLAALVAAQSFRHSLLDDRVKSNTRLAFFPLSLSHEASPFSEDAAVVSVAGCGIFPFPIREPFLPRERRCQAAVENPLFSCEKESKSFFPLDENKCPLVRCFERHRPLFLPFLWFRCDAYTDPLSFPVPLQPGEDSTIPTFQISADSLPLFLPKQSRLSSSSFLESDHRENCWPDSRGPAFSPFPLPSLGSQNIALSFSSLICGVEERSRQAADPSLSSLIFA